jgi:hypothetical protein
MLSDTVVEIGSECNRDKTSKWLEAHLRKEKYREDKRKKNLIELWKCIFNNYY